MDAVSLPLISSMLFSIISIPFLLIFVVIPIIILVKFFNMSADIKRIKLALSQREAADLASKAEILAAIKEGIVELKTAEDINDPKPKVGEWSADITPEIKSEAERLIAEYGVVDGVIVCTVIDNTLDVWSAYRWEKYGAYDSKYRLVYKGY